MRKLKPAEIKLLKEFPKDEKLFSGGIWPGTLYPWNHPENTNIRTLINLFDMGLIEHAFINFRLCPLKLTDKAKKIPTNRD